jgi:hypothetical protein
MLLATDNKCADEGTRWIRYDRVCTLLLCQRIITRTHNVGGLLAGLKSLCIWGASSLTAMGVLHLTALTALTLLRAEGCNTGFGAESADDGDFLHLSSKVSQQTSDLAVGLPRIA